MAPSSGVTSRTEGSQVAVAKIDGVADGAGARVAAVAARHERTLLRVARQASLCHDDALDAYQRALEIFVRRVDTVDPATELSWLKVVVRHEALAIRRAPLRVGRRRGARPRLLRPGHRAQRRGQARRRGARPPLGRSAASAEARRGEGAAAEGPRALLRGDRGEVRVVVYESQQVDHRGQAPLPQRFRGDRIGSRVRAVRADRRGARQPVGERCPGTPDPPPSAPLHRLPSGSPRAPSLPAPPRVAVLACVRHRRAARAAANAQARRRSTLPPRPGLRPGDGSRSRRFRRRRSHRHRRSVVGLCLGGASVGTVCVVTDRVPILGPDPPARQARDPSRAAEARDRDMRGLRADRHTCASSGDGHARARDRAPSHAEPKPLAPKSRPKPKPRRKRSRPPPARAARVSGRPRRASSASSNQAAAPPTGHRPPCRPQPATTTTSISRAATTVGRDAQAIPRLPKFSPAEQEFSP